MEFNIIEAVSLLERTPKVLREYLSGLSEEWTHSNEGKDTWSAYDIVGHLIHGEKTDWMVRTFSILGSDQNKKFEPFDRFAQFHSSKGQSLNQLLDEFEKLREQNLNELKKLKLSDSDLAKQGVHPELGSVSLKELLATWVTHDLGHISQISRVMAKRYKEEVGPWIAYISILNQ